MHIINNKEVTLESKSVLFLLWYTLEHLRNFQIFRFYLKSFCFSWFEIFQFCLTFFSLFLSLNKDVWVWFRSFLQLKNYFSWYPPPSLPSHISCSSRYQTHKTLHDMSNLCYQHQINDNKNTQTYFKKFNRYIFHWALKPSRN